MNEQMQAMHNRLYQLQRERAGKVEELLTSDDPDALNKLIADAINILEALYLVLNAQQQPEGFVSLTPKDS